MSGDRRTYPAAGNGGEHQQEKTRLHEGNRVVYIIIIACCPEKSTRSPARRARETADRIGQLTRTQVGC